MVCRMSICIWLVTGSLLPGAASAADPDAFCNETAALYRQAAPAVVKLYGAGAGREHGYGSGVIVSSDGQILTALSLLVTGREIRAVLHDGRRLPAKLLRKD